MAIKKKVLKISRDAPIKQAKEMAKKATFEDKKAATDTMLAAVNEKPNPIAKKKTEKTQLTKKSTSKKRGVKAKKTGPKGPVKMTEETLSKLKGAFVNLMTDEQASHYAGIHPRTLYRYQAQNPEFCQMKAYWRSTTTMKALSVVAGTIQKGDDFNAKWWLQKGKGTMFSDRPNDEQQLQESKQLLSDEDIKMHKKVLDYNF